MQHQKAKAPQTDTTAETRGTLTDEIEEGNNRRFTNKEQTSDKSRASTTCEKEDDIDHIKFVEGPFTGPL